MIHQVWIGIFKVIYVVKLELLVKIWVHISQLQSCIHSFLFLWILFFFFFEISFFERKWKSKNKKGFWRHSGWRDLSGWWDHSNSSRKFDKSTNLVNDFFFTFLQKIYSWKNRNLSNNTLTGTIPTELGNLLQLQEL